MITVILEDQDSRELERLSEASNEGYLIQDEPDFHYLADLSDCDPSVFSSDDVEGLTGELNRIKSTLKTADEIRHVDDIIRLATICRNNVGFTLTLTPFGWFAARD